MKDFATSLVSYACPICGQEAETAIIMNSVLTEEVAKEVESLHNKCVGYANKACDKCKEYEGVWFISIDPDKSDKDYYRTGHIACIKKESPFIENVRDFIITLEDETQFCYIEYESGKEIGLWQ